MKLLRLSSQELLTKLYVMLKVNESKVKKPVFSYFFWVFDTDKRVFYTCFFGGKHIEYRTEMPIGRLSSEFLFGGSLNESKNRRVQG